MQTSNSFRDFNWNVYSWGLIALCLVFQIMQWPASPKFIDIYYHLAVMRGFAESGGYVTEAFWEFAPVGRPHLYPPFLHVLLLIFNRLGLSAITLARLADVLAQPVLLAALWAFLRGLYTRRLAFFGVLLTSSVYSFYVTATVHPAFTLALAPTFLVFLSLHRGRLLAAAVLTGLLFYTHLGMAGMAAGAVFLYGLVRGRMRRPAFTALGGGFLLALPFLWFQAHYAGFFAFVPVRENRFLELDPLIYGLSLVGVVTAFRRKGVYLLPLCLLVAMLPMAVTHRARFWSGQGMIAFLILAAVALEAFFTHRRFASRNVSSRAVVLAGVVTVFLFAAPVVVLNLKERDGAVRFFDRFVSHYVLPVSLRHERAKEHTIYFPDEYARIVRIVRTHSKPRHLVWSDFSYGGGLIGVLAGRATSSGMVPEVRPWRPFDPLAAARILIWFKRGDGRVPEGMSEAVEGQGLKKLYETEMVHIYENPSARAAPDVPAPLVPFGMILALLLGAIGLVICDYVRIQSPKNP